MEDINKDRMSNGDISLSEIRDSLIRKKALYEENQRKLDETIEKLKPKINGLKQSTIDGLSERGINVDFITHVDYDRLKIDNVYLQEFTSEVGKVILAIKNRLVNI